MAVKPHSLFTTLLVVAVLTQKTFSAEKPNTGACVFDKYHKDHLLQNVDRIQDLIGKSFKSEDAMENWRFTVGICADLKLDGADDNAAVVQQKITAEGKPDTEDTKLHNIGSLKNTHLMAGRDWALLEYKDGEQYTSHCGNQPKRTLILLYCDESIGDSDAKMVYVEEDSNKEEGCYYLFEMRHKALCPKATGSTLGVGSILVITFFSLVGLYLLLGFLYQRFVLGSKGLEQIPNYEFWKDLGNLQADGCDFICRSKGRQNNGFRGLGDDQLEREEEIRDDNLLPM